MSKSAKTDKPKKTSRLEVRVTEDYKKNIETAAYLRGQNMTEYVLDVLAEASNQTIKQHQLLELTRNDLNSFVDALLNPSVPTEQAVNDAKWYQQIIENNQL
jgi:uncharacterized protein (DUF1778 family)